MKKNSVALILLVFVVHILFANDTFFSLSGGNLVPVTEDSVPVEMKEERIILDFQKDFYEVTVDFSFYNTGKTTQLTVGFPFFAPGNLGNGKIYDFKCWTDGKETSFDDLPIVRSWDSSNQPKLENAYTRTIVFKNKELTTTRITYKSTYGNTRWDGYYLYGTGSSWKNTIGKITLIVVNNLPYGYPESIRMGSNIWGESIKKRLIKKDDKTFEAVFYNVEPAEYTDIFYVHFEDILNDSGPKRFPAYFPYNKRITDSKELAWYRKDQLRILRNTIYALHGYPFKSEDLRDFFEANSAEWSRPYKADDRFSEAMLSAIEKENVKIISEEEKRR